MTKYRTYGAYVLIDSRDTLSMTADEVLIEDDGPTYTGLVDSAGQRLYRESAKIPVGFYLKEKDG